MTAHQLPDPGFALVDDYWMSFVLSHRLRVPIWKIRAESMISFSESAFDPQQAMCYDPIVREQRINFYVYHMRQGWPFESKMIARWSDKEVTDKLAPGISSSAGYVVIDHYSR